MRVDGVLVLAHDLAHFVGDVAHFHRIRADDAELHREADRRPEVEAVDAHARFRQGACRQRLFQPRLDALARFHVLRHDDDLGEGLVRQLRVEAEPEAGRALADIGGVGGDVLVPLDHRLGLAGSLGRHADRGAFGQAHLEEQLGPFRQREELLLHAAEGDHGGGEDADRRDHDDDAVAHAPLDHPAQRVVEARLVDLVRVVMRGRDLA